MLPFGGQGSNQAMEDAGALGFLFNNIGTGGEVSKSLALFDTVRRSRASRAQVLSKVRVGKEQDVREELLKYADPPGSGKSSLASCMCTKSDYPTAVPGTFAERTLHDYGLVVSPSTLGPLWLIIL